MRGGRAMGTASWRNQPRSRNVGRDCAFRMSNFAPQYVNHQMKNTFGVSVWVCAFCYAVAGLFGVAVLFNETPGSMAPTDGYGISQSAVSTVAVLK